MVLQVWSLACVVPAMPVDFMRICLGRPPTFHKLLDSYEDLHSIQSRKPLRPCLNPKSLPGGWGRSSTQEKKRVVFADMKGLSLTAVRIFSKMEEDLCDLQLALAHLIKPMKDLAPGPKPYTLDFPQPSSDYLDFRNRLKHDLVCLEQCLVQEALLTGTIKVRNVGFEKKVRVRVTFDAWHTFHDMVCVYMPNTYGVAETDTFSFRVELPRVPSPQDDIQFCVSFQCRQNIYWDNNRGQNYHIRQLGRSLGCAREDPAQLHSPSSVSGMVFSHWTGWPSNNCIGPYW